MTVSAPCGTCKTSFAYALAAAITRLAEHDPSAPYGVVFLVEQKEQADSAYRELIQLLPDKVRVWTEDHDLAGNKSDNTKDPRAATKWCGDTLRNRTSAERARRPNCTWRPLLDSHPGRAGVRATAVTLVPPRSAGSKQLPFSLRAGRH